MFVLIYSDNELLSEDNKVKTFKTKDDAHNEMLRQFVDAAANEGIRIVQPDDDGDVVGIDEWGEDTGWVGYITDDCVYLDQPEQRWVIFEVKE